MQKCSLGYKLDLVQNVGCRAHGGLLPRASGGRFRSKKKARGGRFRSKKKFNNAGLCAKKKLLRLGVATVRVVKDDGGGCLVKVLLQKCFDSVDVDGVECSRFIRSLRHIYPDDVPILSQVNARPHNKVVHYSVHENARHIPSTIVDIPSQCTSGPDYRNFPCGNRNHPYELTCIPREITIGNVRNNPVDIVLQIILRGLWLLQMASHLHTAQVDFSQLVVGVEAGGTRCSS